MRKGSESDENDAGSFNPEAERAGSWRGKEGARATVGRMTEEVVMMVGRMTEASEKSSRVATRRKAGRTAGRTLDQNSH